MDLEKNLVRELLVNLAIRYRLARKLAREAKKLNLTIEFQLHQDGAMLEAWNSFQAAKSIANAAPKNATSSVD